VVRGSRRSGVSRLRSARRADRGGRRRGSAGFDRAASRARVVEGGRGMRRARNARDVDRSIESIRSICRGFAHLRELVLDAEEPIVHADAPAEVVLHVRSALVVVRVPARALVRERVQARVLHVLVVRVVLRARVVLESRGAARGANDDDGRARAATRLDVRAEGRDGTECGAHGDGHCR